MSLYIVDKDISTMNVDAVVMPVNQQLKILPGGEYLYDSLDKEALRSLWGAFKTLGETDVFITPGMGAWSRFVLYALGMSPSDSEEDLERYVKSCMRCLAFAAEKGLQTVAFPLVGWDIDTWMQREIMDNLGEAMEASPAVRHMTAYICINSQIIDRYEVWDDLDGRLFAHLAENKAAEIQRAIDRRLYILPRVYAQRVEPGPMPEDVVREDLAELLRHKTLTFSALLCQFMEKEGLTDAEVYNAAYIDRRHFAKLKKQGAAPKKRTVLALILGLRLNKKEAEQFLAAAGYAFSNADPTDIIIQYFLEKHRYDVAIINSYLFEYGQPLLGSAVRE